MLILDQRLLPKNNWIEDFYIKILNIMLILDRKSIPMYMYWYLHIIRPYLLTLPLRALSPAWTGSPAQETLISRTHLFLPHDLPPTKKSSTIKSWPTFCDQYFWKFPIWNSRADEKRREIRMVKVFKWYPVIDLFDTFTGKLGHGD